MVSQFTLAANTDKGLRPSFSGAAEPATAKQYYLQLVARLKENLQSTMQSVETGEFGADMQVSLVNDGPVTFLLEV